MLFDTLFNNADRSFLSSAIGLVVYCHSKALTCFMTRHLSEWIDKCLSLSSLLSDREMDDLVSSSTLICILTNKMMKGNLHTLIHTL